MEELKMCRLKFWMTIGLGQWSIWRYRTYMYILLKVQARALSFKEYHFLSSTEPRLTKLSWLSHHSLSNMLMDYQRPIVISKSRSRSQIPVGNLQQPQKSPMTASRKWMFFATSNQGREPKLKSWVIQKPVTISKSRSRCQTPVRNPQCPTKPQMMT